MSSAIRGRWPGTGWNKSEIATTSSRRLLPGREERGSQLVEFAVALPLLVVFVVGIFDFSGAFTLKQKLTNAARDAARAAAAEPLTDLSAAVPMSVNDVFWNVDNYLKANRVNDCGIGAGNHTHAAGSTIWTYSMTGSGCAAGGLKIIINRGYYLPATSAAVPATLNCTVQSASGQTAVIATCVSIQYGYGWTFGRAASLLGATAMLPGTITATAVAMNEN